MACRPMGGGSEVARRPMGVAMARVAPPTDGASKSLRGIDTVAEPEATRLPPDAASFSKAAEARSSMEEAPFPRPHTAEQACDVSRRAALSSPVKHAVADSTVEQERRAKLLKLRRQLEWYFTDANLSTDHKLYKLIKDACPDGWVSCTSLLRCRRIKELQATAQLILNALQPSHLEVKVLHHVEDAVTKTCNLERCLYVRRRQPLPPLLRHRCRSEDGTLNATFEDDVVEDPYETVNRLRDQMRVQRTLRLREVGDSSTRFYERLSSSANRSGSPVVLAVGYERVLYGDGGAYIECTRDQVKWSSWPHYFNKRHFNSYYDEWYTLTSYKRWCVNWERWAPWPSKGVLMLYEQRQPVSDRPWAPSAAAHPHARRPNGYADYRPGLFYFAADEALISVNTGDGDQQSTALPNTVPSEASRRGYKAAAPRAVDTAARLSASSQASMIDAATSGDFEPASLKVAPEDLANGAARSLAAAAALSAQALVADESSAKGESSPRTPTASTEACTVGDDWSPSCRFSPMAGSDWSAASTARSSASAVCEASSTPEAEDVSLAATKQQAIPRPPEAANLAYDLCWNYRAGRCARGRRCKWRHA